MLWPKVISLATVMAEHHAETAHLIQWWTWNWSTNNNQQALSPLWLLPSQRASAQTAQCSLSSSTPHQLLSTSKRKQSYQWRSISSIRLKNISEKLFEIRNTGLWFPCYLAKSQISLLSSWVPQQHYATCCWRSVACGASGQKHCRRDRSAAICVTQHCYQVLVWLKPACCATKMIMLSAYQKRK